EGARIEVPRLGLSELTDHAGRFVLSAVPAGAHEIVVSYLGLDTVRSLVTVAPGQSAVRDFDLTTGIYKLDAFKVVGEREGDAAAITAQRNALNVKNVVAMDSFGNLPNMSAGEVIMRLPGVAGSPTEEGLNYQFNIRGMSAALNTVTMDGARLSALGFNRAFENQSITSGMFDQLELIKGHTPDKSAESLGGTINFKSRSALNMKEKRRITYNFSARIAPSFTQQIPTREQHRSQPPDLRPGALLLRRLRHLHDPALPRQDPRPLPAQRAQHSGIEGPLAADRRLPQWPASLVPYHRPAHVYFHHDVRSVSGDRCPDYGPPASSHHR
ncbi:MAG: TonB-dependent receptor plug domain-containing protein, partial [Verrucomicrobia bacterium]|nr:TonB-dependent receptor plug domain-containing protein [Verrucomicrobiota bacterium]